MTTPTAATGDAVMPVFVRALGTFHEVREQLMDIARSHPDTVLQYLKTVPQDFTDIPGGELLRDLESLAAVTLEDAASQSLRSARH